MGRRDITVDGSNSIVEYVQWPDTVNGTIDVNGTVRPMTVAETAQWQAFTDAETRDAERTELRADLDLTRTVRADAVQARTDMDPAAPLPKWAPLAGTGTNAQRLTELERTVNALVVDQRKQYADTRQLSGVLVRLLRNLRLDQ